MYLLYIDMLIFHRYVMVRVCWIYGRVTRVRWFEARFDWSHSLYPSAPPGWKGLAVVGDVPHGFVSRCGIVACHQIAILTWKIMKNTNISTGFETCPTTPHARNRWTSGKLMEITWNHFCVWSRDWGGFHDFGGIAGRCTGSQSFTGPLGKGPHESPWKPMKAYESPWKPMKAGFWSLGHLKLPRST